MNQSVEFKCKCETKTKFHFKKPHVVQASLAGMHCKGCKSTWMHRVSVAKGQSGHVTLQSKLTFVSPGLAEIIKAEEDWNKLSPEEQEAQSNDASNG